MGKNYSKQEEVVINNNAGVSSIFQGRGLSDFGLIALTLFLFVVGYLIIRKVKEYFARNVRRQIVAQAV